MPRGTSRYDEALLQGRLWTPALIPPSQLLAWHDFTDLSTLNFPTTTLVDTARDKSGNANTIANVAGGANRPTFSMTAINKRSPGLVFAAGQSLFGTVSWSLTALSAFVVMSTTGSGYARIIDLVDSSAGDTAGNGMCAILHQNNSTDGTQSYYSGDKATAPLASNSTGTASAFVASTVHDGTNATGFMNGVSGTTVANTITTIAPAKYSVGGAGSGSGGLAGAISEVVFLSVATPLWLRQKIEGYLLHKHKIPSVFLSPPASGTTLCGNHPYWTFPPTIGG